MATIMVVDDAMFMRKKCVQLLTEQGHQVMEAANGAEALAKYREMKPDGVVLEALKSGAIDFVVKPFDAARVKAAVQKLLS